MTNEEKLISKLRFHKLINGILLLTLAGGLLLYFLYKPKRFDMQNIGEKMFGEVPPEIAQKNLGIYRHNGAYASLSIYPGIKVKGVLHDTADLHDYLTNKFKKFTATHTPKDSCVWQIGVYPMVCKETRAHPNKPRIGFYLIPTMVNKFTNEIKDYIKTIQDPKDRIYYINNSERDKAKPLEDRDYIFDEGHLWP